MGTTWIAVSVIIADALNGFPTASRSVFFAGRQAKTMSNIASPNTEQLPLTSDI
jgi:hypothetical protein